jgi:hypothetical protein
MAEPESVLPGHPVRLAITGFPPNVPLTLALVSQVDAFSERQIAATMTDERGTAAVVVVVPADIPFGDAGIRVASEGCSWDAYVGVVGSDEGIGLDDDTVTPGQSVTLTATGFQPGDSVGVMLDGDAFDALSEGRSLASGTANEAGAVRITVRIPPDVSPGPHFLTANGYSFDGENDLFLRADFTVEG